MDLYLQLRELQKNSFNPSFLDKVSWSPDITSRLTFISPASIDQYNSHSAHALSLYKKNNLSVLLISVHYSKSLLDLIKS